MWNISRHLYLGQESDALAFPRLNDAGITHVLSCTREIPCPFADDLNYLHLPLSDPDPLFHSHIATACEFMERGRKAGTVFVHCKGVVSRSPAVVLAYLCYGGLSLADAAATLGKMVPTRPSEVFITQIAAHFGELLKDGDLERIYELLEGDRQRLQ